MQLLNSIRRCFSGKSTQLIQHIMNNFKPVSQNSITQVLKKIYSTKEYSPYNTQTQEKFVQSIQNFYFRSKEFNRATITNFYLMQRMGYTNSGFRFNLARKVKRFHIQLSSYLQKDSTIENIKNQRLQSLLWFLKKQFPIQPKYFEEAASLYSLKIHQLVQYMNGLQKIPKWQPYIRVCYILKCLGHQVKIRQDLLTRHSLEHIDHKYYYFLSEIIPSQKYEQINNNLKTTYPFLTFLLQRLFLQDQMKYDQYLQKLQLIDNIQLKQEINKSLDVISWSDIVYVFELVAKSYYLEGQFDDNQYKFYTLFDRKFETLSIPIQQAATILLILNEYPNFMLNQRHSMVKLIIDAMIQLPKQQFQGVDPEIFLILLKNIQMVSLDLESQKRIKQFLLTKIKTLIFWNQQNKNQFIEYFESNEFLGKKQIIQFLNNLKIK